MTLLKSQNTWHLGSKRGFLLKQLSQKYEGDSAGQGGLGWRRGLGPYSNARIVTDRDLIHWIHLIGLMCHFRHLDIRAGLHSYVEKNNFHHACLLNSFYFKQPDSVNSRAPLSLHNKERCLGNETTL